MKSEKYGDLSREELVRLLERRGKEPQRRFGLVWEQDDSEREAAPNADFVALEPDDALSCGEAPYRNLLIEGDNYDALRYLRMTHAGRVKCILIDPPYNTVNRDFIYNAYMVMPEGKGRREEKDKSQLRWEWNTSGRLFFKSAVGMFP